MEEIGNYQNDGIKIIIQSNKDKIEYVDVLDCLFDYQNLLLIQAKQSVFFKTSKKEKDKNNDI